MIGHPLCQPAESFPERCDEYCHCFYDNVWIGQHINAGFTKFEVDSRPFPKRKFLWQLFFQNHPPALQAAFAKSGISDDWSKDFTRCHFSLILARLCSIKERSLWLCMFLSYSKKVYWKETISYKYNCSSLKGGEANNNSWPSSWLLRGFGKIESRNKGNTM